MVAGAFDERASGDSDTEVMLCSSENGGSAPEDSDVKVLAYTLETREEECEDRGKPPPSDWIGLIDSISTTTRSVPAHPTQDWPGLKIVLKLSSTPATSEPPKIINLIDPVSSTHSSTARLKRVSRGLVPAQKQSAPPPVSKPSDSQRLHPLGRAFRQAAMKKILSASLANTLLNSKGCLFDAINLGDIDKVKELVETGYDVVATTRWFSGC
ncbi:hypothetical protein K440DRAFT_630393 [Wilcoxina mikolae CBS 423.85]|nr:hypothetical protein K440DRAFT_630393 [Wilcoxina mikolae CBS 423.85]